MSTQRQARLRILRQREGEGVLTGSERAELDQIFREMDAEESASLARSTSELEAEIASVEAANAALTRLVEREQRLVIHLRQVLDEANAEREAIREELAQITGGGKAHSNAIR